MLTMKRLLPVGKQHCQLDYPIMTLAIYIYNADEFGLFYRALLTKSMHLIRIVRIDRFG